MLVNAEVTDLNDGKPIEQRNGFSDRAAAWQWVIDYISSHYPRWSEKIVRYSKEYQEWWTPIDLSSDVAVRVWEDKDQ